jgi:hypothetical protein
MRSITYKTNTFSPALRPGLKKPLMPVRQQLESLKKQVLSFSDGRILFDAPVNIKNLFNCHGAWADAHQGLWLLDGLGEWHQISHDDVNAVDVITGVSKKIKSLSNEHSNILSEC